MPSRVGTDVRRAHRKGFGIGLKKFSTSPCAHGSKTPSFKFAASNSPFRLILQNCNTIMPVNTSQVRSLYRSILRELPHRPISSPSPLHRRIRSTFSTTSFTPEQLSSQIDQGQQFVQYAKAQRLYATLLERYNPGMGIDEEERVRLTMRRVGMQVPEEFKGGRKE